MDLDDYQARSLDTDQNPREESESTGGLRGSDTPAREEVIPLLGLVGEVGSLLAEYKKLLRDGQTHRRFKDEVAEELGDILWYVSNVASKYDLTLSEIAAANLEKTRDRYRDAPSRGRLYDDDQSPSAQLPRVFEYAFEHRQVGRGQRLVLVDLLRPDEPAVGDPLSDNAPEDDGYRYHDVFHLTLAAHFGWSPVYRKLLRQDGGRPLEHRSPPATDEVQDGGRAQVVEEAIVLAAYGHASFHEMYAGATAVDWELLRHVKRLTQHVEVRDRSTKEWNDTILRAFAIWRELIAHGGGVVSGDLRSGKISFRVHE